MVSLMGCREQIVHNLGEADANRLLTSLSRVSIEAEKVKQADGKWAVAVERSASLRAIDHLDTAHLLRETGENASPKASMISSREDQRFRYERALSGELEATLRNIPGVLEARVHLNLPVVDPLFGQPVDDKKGSASVLLVNRSEKLGKEQIAALVSGAAGIPTTLVSVLVSTSDETAESTASGTKSAQVVPPASMAKYLPLGFITGTPLLSLGVGLILGGSGLLAYLWLNRKISSAQLGSRMGTAYERATKHDA
jgi:type III secretion protein J